MRRVREILRLKYEGDATERAIARSLGVARSTVALTLERAAAAKLSWPLPATLTDRVLEAMLYASTGAPRGGRRKAEPDWTHVHRDHRLRGEILQQRDLVVGKRSHLGAGRRKHPEKLIIASQRHAWQCAAADRIEGARSTNGTSCCATSRMCVKGWPSISGPSLDCRKLDILGVIHRRRCLPIRALRLRRNFCRRKAPDCRARRLDLMVRQIEQLERHIKISNEAIALFVRFWLTSTPPLPDTARPAAKPKGASAMKVFVEALGRRLARGHPLAEELSAGVNGRSDRDAV